MPGRDQLPGEFLEASRDEIAQKYLRDLKLRNPGADVGPDTPADVDSKLVADALFPLYRNAALMADALSDDDLAGQTVDDRLEQMGLDARYGAVGAGGFVIARTVAAGGTILAGDEIKNELTGLRYQCVETKTYNNGDLVPILGIDKGPSTNIDPGVVLKWTSPRPGVSALASVYQDSNGFGLTGGALEEADENAIQRIKDARRNPGVRGNEDDFQVEAKRTPGVPVEQVFTYSCFAGPGTMGVTFTVRPAALGAPRVPSDLQVQLVRAHLNAIFNADDSIAVFGLLTQNTDIALGIDWVSEATWADVVPWPLWSGGSPATVTVPSDTMVVTLNGAGLPAVGKRFALWDYVNHRWVRKTIATVVDGGATATLTFDTANNASDTSYNGTAGQPISPWSDALEDLTQPVLKYFGSLGSGEQFSSFKGDGRRQRRFPFAPKEWPHTVDNRLIGGFRGRVDAVLDLDSVLNASILSGSGSAPTIGTPGATAYLRTLRYLTAYPLT